ncbi:MAG: InlB B-repeat-containing protein, partial [Paludibacteraceae bacterium]|nr:InlB B-repeat-containing protein [Paludibacteraceae bacterium]
GKEPTYSEGKWYLKADKEREYTLTVSVDDAEDAKCNVKFVKPSVSKLTFNPTSYTVEEAGSLSLKTNLQITPADGFKADTVKVTWSSSKESVATIDQNGKVQAISAGKATITANAGGKTATCTVEVTAKPTPEDPEKPEEPEKPEDPDTPVDPSDPEIPIVTEYTVSYDANGGTGSMSEVKVKENETITIAENAFTRSMFQFTGWNTKADGTGTSYADKASIKVTQSITLYAQWKEYYTITFDANGGTGSMSEVKVKENETITIAENTFTRTMFKFAGWNTKSDGTGTSYADKASIKVTQSITLYAQWNKYYTITFDANGGTGSMSEMTGVYAQYITLTENKFTRAGYYFRLWNTKSDGTGTSYADTASIKVTQSITLYAQWRVSTGIADGHEWVDLGFGTKWATMNVGAESPEDYGDYFAWAETSPKSTYNWSTYKWCSVSANSFYLTKYCGKSQYGAVDNRIFVNSSDDAAYVNWGSNWRYPSANEFSTLMNPNFTKWTWTTQNGVNGYKVTSLINGNSIFLPAAGMYKDSNTIGVGTYGYYWTDYIYTYQPFESYGPYFNSREKDSETTAMRYEGYSIRPVLSE